jgi:ferredoxin
MQKKPREGVILDKKDLEGLFERLVTRYAVYGLPNNGHEKTICRVRMLAELDVDHKNTTVSLKRHFLPQTETLLSFDAAAGGSHVTGERKCDKEHILFAVRPCDAMAIALMDRLFIEDGATDPYYARRRSQTTIVAFACIEPGPTCFCSSVGGGPDSETGADLVFYDLKDRYYIRKVTEQGTAVLDIAGVKISAATAKDREEKDRLMDRARAKLKKEFDAVTLAGKLEDFDADIWETLHQKCLGCGVCTYLCPTCHCFDITDEIVKAHGRRVRTWDSCMFPLFTLHASGHNPRPAAKQRMRQRLMHKFNYAPKNAGRVFCVGCGRCIIHCPVNLDIRTVLSKIAGVT